MFLPYSKRKKAIPLFKCDYLSDVLRVMLSKRGTWLDLISQEMLITKKVRAWHGDKTSNNKGCIGS